MVRFPGFLSLDPDGHLPVRPTFSLADRPPAAFVFVSGDQLGGTTGHDGAPQGGGCGCFGC